ncbi:MAG: phosphopyruvate hydratase [Dehalococcoidia bacterium]
MSNITDIKAREILDSRGNPTVQVEVFLADGSTGLGTVPSGASTGKHEAVELRDTDSTRYRGMGVRQAVNNIRTVIKENMLNMDSSDQTLIDERMIELDGTDNKNYLGANAILGVSLAVARAEASSRRVPLFEYLSFGESNTLPVPFFNILNGGAHATESTDYQEFMVAPVGAPSFSEALRMGNEIYYSLRSLLNQNNLSTNVGDEGGFAPELKSNQEALELIVTSIESIGLDPAIDCKLAIDVAATELWDRKDNSYLLPREKQKYSADQMINNLENLVQNFPLLSIEDALAEDDWEGWMNLTSRLGSKVQLVGDDLFVTTKSRLERGIANQVANSILVKFNQVGTLTETLDVIKIAKDNSYSTMISHRSGETEDTTIADLAVAVNSGQIKAGAPARGERTAKYNRLLVIEEILGARAKYAGNLIGRIN